MNGKLSNGLKILIAGLLLIPTIPALAFAETFKGEVTHVNDKQTFTLLYEAKSKKEMQVWITPETKFSGLSSLSEIVNGDEMTVTAQLNQTNSHWEADSLELTKVVIRNPSPEAPVIEALTEESEYRAVEEKAEKPAFDLAETESRFATMEKQIDALQKKAANSPATLQEKTDILMADLNKKRMLLKAKIEELKTASPDQVEKLTQDLLHEAAELDHALVTASEEITADKITVA